MRLSYVPFDTQGYHNIINRGFATRVYYTGPSIGHVVVGLGYDDDTNEAIVLDPDRPGDTRRKLFNQIQPAPAGAAGEGYLIGEPSIPDFNGRWENGEMEFLEIPDYQDTPSTFSPTRPPAFHLSTWREWLGPGVSSEINFNDALDDEDGIANVNNMDRFDDGVILHRETYRPGALGAIDALITTQRLTDELRYDPANAATWLNLNGWADWNGDGEFTPDEQIVDWSGGPGVNLPGGPGTHLVSFTFNVPEVIPEEYWIRFRLDRGEDVGPYGFAEFGEVEDYLVPEPATAALFLGAAALGLRRRRGCR